MYEDIYDAKMAVDHLSGFNVANRYLIVLYYNPAKQNKKVRRWIQCPTRAKAVRSFGAEAVSVASASGHSMYAHSLMHIAAPQVSTKQQEEELRKMQEKHGVDGEQHARKQGAKG